MVGRGERSQTSTTDLNVPVTWALRCRVTEPGDTVTVLAR